MCLWCAPGGAARRRARCGRRAGGVLLCVRCVHMGRALRGPAPGPATNMMKLLWLVMTCLKLVPD